MKANHTLIIINITCITYVLIRGLLLVFACTILLCIINLLWVVLLANNVGLLNDTADLYRTAVMQQSPEVSYMISEVSYILLSACSLRL